VEHADAEVSRAIQEILARPELAPPQADWLAHVCVELLLWLEDVIRGLEAMQVTAPVPFWLMSAVLSLCLAALIAYVVIALARALRADASPALATPAIRRRDYASEARALADVGRYLDASHCLLLGTLERVARARVIELRPENTNRSIRGMLARSALPAPLTSALLPLLERTERARYREGRAEAALYEQWTVAYAQLDRALGRP
jgi:hypothetical protein